MKIPAELVEQFARGNGAIFVGERLSVQAGLPSLKKLGTSLAREIDGCPTELSFQDVAYDYELDVGRQRLVSRLKKQLDTFHFQPTPVHDAQLRLPTNYIFTTNYDDLLEKAAYKTKRPYHSVIGNADANFWTADQLQLVKLHGDLSQPESLVITRDDYDLYASQHPALVRLLAVALQTRAVLFLGYNADDANLRQLLTQMRAEAGTLARNGFALLLNASPREIKRLQARQMQVINLEVAIPSPLPGKHSAFRRKEHQAASQTRLNKEQLLL